MLAVTDLKKNFGSVEALRGVSISLAPGEVRAVCGENGAGKSTLLKVLMGIHRADSGTITLDGKPVEIGSPREAQQLGIALVAQELSLAPHLSVLDNIWLGHQSVPFFHRRRALRDRARQALEMLDVGLDLNRTVGSLNMGERQLVEIARLLARDARILVLDEPTATLSDVEIEKMMAALGRLKTSGKSILYVTHRLGEIFQICDSVSVLRNGRDVAHAAIADVDRERLIEWMLGRQFADMYPAHETKSQTSNAYVVSGLNVPGAVSDFSIVAQRGAITAIAGQVGSGAQTVIRALAGLEERAIGQVSLDDIEVPLRSIKARQMRNIAYITDDRAGEGLFARSVLENVSATRLVEHTRAGIISWDSVRRSASEICRRVTIDENRLQDGAFELSGGNQQKLLFTRAVGADGAGVLLINEPTRGVDVGARAEIYKLLRDFCAAGYAILLASTDLEEIVGIADRVVTMFRGEIVAHYERENISAGQILSDIIHPASSAAQAVA